MEVFEYLYKSILKLDFEGIGVKAELLSVS